MASDPRDTPAMRQYARFKQLHPGCILLFRMGDFYEMFDDDAVTASKAIGLTLTQRTAGVPMAGMPYHQLETYLRKFIAAGFRVAVCDQLQDPAEAKGIVDRGVTRVITPGTLVDESLLADDTPNVIAAVCFPPAGGKAGMEVGKAAVAVAELSTGRFWVLELDATAVGDELARRRVSELMYPETVDGKPPARLAGMLTALGVAGTPRAQWHFRPEEAKQSLCDQFGVATLEGFGFAEGDALVMSAGALVRYLRDTQSPGDADAGAGRKRGLGHLQPPRRVSMADHLVIDAVSLRALEVDRTIRGAQNGAAVGARDGSLVGIFTTSGGRTLCRTSMGKRLLREWLCNPLRDAGAIKARQRCVGTLVEDRRFAEEVGRLIEPVQDVARIAARVGVGRCTARDLVALGKSVGVAGALREHLASAPAFARQAAEAGELAERLEGLAAEIGRMCVEEPPSHMREGGLIRDGVDKALDEVRTLKANAAAWLAEYQKKLIDEHGLPNLRVGFNKIFGYFIELPKAQAQRAPAAFSRRQTLTNAERYITPELKDFEDKVTHAEARAVEREAVLFQGLCDKAAEQIGAIGRFGEMVAEVDVLLTFAEKAVQRRWCAPVIAAEAALNIKGGRHPVVEELLEHDFVPNDLAMGTKGAEGGGARLALITGPNMAGKSTFIRQTALIVLLAHTGSFVPAEAATIGLCDRIFTRVGADDALFAGQSTFMVEMTETANILHHATERSLVILDEIGRGTSTLDGLSLAWAIAETLAGTGKGGVCPRTLFATHYHELTRLEELLPGHVMNLQVAVREWQDQIVFLHRILPGRADRSYGIHVARLAGLPASTVKRAGEVLESLAVEHSGLVEGKEKIKRLVGGAGRKTDDGQLALFREFVPHPAVEALKEVKLDGLSPLEAFDELRRLHGLLKENGA